MARRPATVEERSARETNTAAGEESFEESVPVVDGNRLHYCIPPRKWCVTRKDVEQFRRLVRRAVLDGRIRPTESDQFDPTDDRVGPTVHTVCEQYVSPVTFTAGSPSWALMLHNDGLDCDMFVSHSWQEGIYELIDKMLFSWPARAHSAYLCFLSNPQNSSQCDSPSRGTVRIDIGHLISSPIDSPFAHALRSATHVMVVSNKQGSIYSRIWCTYEAYLAYTMDKHIFRASSPVHDLWPRVVSQLGLCIVSLAIGALLWILFVFLRLDEFGYPFLALLILTMLICKIDYVIQRKKPEGNACRRSCAVTGGAASICIGFIMQMDASLVNFFGVVVCVAYSICLEADRLWLVEAAQERANLLKGYTGHVRDARCSVPEDGSQIRRELRDQDANVDHCVEVLIRTGLSSKHLRSAARIAGGLGNCSNWYMASVVSAVGALWIYMPAHSAWWGDDCTSEHDECTHACLTAAYACVVQATIWCVLFRFVLGPDRRTFASKSLLLMLVGAAMYVMISACAYVIATSIFLGPSVLTLTLAGPANVARIPAVGPIVVRFAIGDQNSCNPFVRPEELRDESAAAEVYGARSDTTGTEDSSPKGAEIDSPNSQIEYV
ncbi:unnamed protein product [Prorocentrum cordatum]|uniref:Transmembrane protein n=1 Tax=Prorocentrum cordatum TaxID=2364126 RepID=A0ABN9SCJ5_9DINO|nr:unnamed protein product [Polarella glacialis]